MGGIGTGSGAGTFGAAEGGDRGRRPVALDADRDRLYRNRGDGTFEDVTKAAGLNKVLAAMALNYGDLDNDGWLDFYAGTGTPDLGMLVPNRMFRNDAGKRFQEVTTSGNFGPFSSCSDSLTSSCLGAPAPPSRSRRCWINSPASVVLPEPLTPLRHTRRPSGTVTSIFRRLCRSTPRRTRAGVGSRVLPADP